MKPKTRYQMRLLALQNKNRNVTEQDEGRWTITFQFDNRIYKKSHQLSPGEIKHMKDLCISHGDEASGQVVWLAAIRGVGMVSENIMAIAGQDFIRNHGPVRLSPKEAPAPIFQPSYDDLVKLEEERNPNEDSNT